VGAATVSRMLPPQRHIRVLYEASSNSTATHGTASPVEGSLIGSSENAVISTC
jgi:hypothetical protein